MFRKLIQSISASEWQFFWLITLAVVVLTTAPTLYGWLITPADQVFTAMHFVSADDWFVYYSFINQAKAGAFLFDDLFASIDHQPVVRPLWWGVGLLARAFDFSAPVAFHLARLLLTPGLFFVVYLFIAHLFPGQLIRKITLAFVAFASGIGTFFIHRLVLYPQNYATGAFSWPMDLWVPDVNTFLTVLASPHFIAATLLLALIFLGTIFFVEQRRWRYAVLAGLAALVLFSFHPFQILKVFAVVGTFFVAFMVMRKKLDFRLLAGGGLMVLLSLPSVVYYWWLLETDWLTVLRAMQNINPTTPLWLTVVSFGALLPLALAGSWVLFRDRRLKQPAYLFVVVWLLVQLVLLYAPVNYQRRLALGVHVPMVFLSMIFFEHALRRWPLIIASWRPTLMMLGVLVFLPSSVFALAADVMVFSGQRELSYLHRDEYQGFLWLHEQAPLEAVVFSDVKTGNVLPAFSLRRSYVGHAVETPYYRARLMELQWFFSHDRSPAVEQSFLKSRGVHYLWYGPREQALGNFTTEGKAYLKSVYESPSVSIYQVL